MTINLRDWVPIVKVESHSPWCPKRILGKQGYAADRCCTCKPPVEVTDNAGQVVRRIDEDGVTA